MIDHRQSDNFGLANRKLASGKSVGLFPQTILTLLISFATGWIVGPHLLAQDQPVRQYSDEVVAKAEKILEDNGLRRVGNQIQTVNYTEMTRTLAEEPKQSRALKLVRKNCEEAEAKLDQLQKQIQTLDQQLGQMNAQYAAVGNPMGINNDLVARINAGTSQLNQMVRVRENLEKELANRKSELSKAEERYAELVLKLRRTVDEMREAFSAAAEVEEVGIAFRVLATRYDSPSEVDVDALIAPLDRKVLKLEESIFSETIELIPEGGALTVQVVIGVEPVNMLVDSGASMVLVPRELAEKLNIEAGADAKTLTLQTADGRRIKAKEISLPRVRVGKFEAKDVRAALLDEAVAGAKPLLGMSFFENFKFEIDTQQKQLKMLKVELE